MLKFLLDKLFEKTKGDYPFFKYCPEKYKIYYTNKKASVSLGYDYNFLEPKSFNEKIRWLIYNEKLPIKALLTDKIKVKTYITEKVGNGHIAQIYGIWNDFNDIDFSYLPNSFVIKTNHASWTNIFINDKKQCIRNKKELKKLTDDFLKIRYYYYSNEPQYKNMKPKLFIEQLIRGVKFREDVQIHCCNGTPSFVEMQSNKISKFYDMNFKELNYNYNTGKNTENIPKPKLLDEMISIAKILCEGFSYVRIDFANIEQRVVVLEMTFTPYAGLIPFENKIMDYELGTILQLPDVI